MTYHDSLRYIEEFRMRGINLDLGPISRLLERLGAPQKDYKSVLIGGTNGKGSVAAMLASMLHCAGYTVGLYTSPHLHDFRERIRVGGEMIPPDALVDTVERVKACMAEEVTYFELATALALKYFSMRAVDIAVLEVGMGGRLDATNVVMPELSIVTNVSLEHRKYLGRTLEAITREKGGIVKTGGICLTGTGRKKVRDVLRDICRENRATFYLAGEDMRMHSDGPHVFSYYGIYGSYHGLGIPLTGGHQRDNATIAIGAVEILNSRGWVVRDNAVTEGLRCVTWEGRLETIHRCPSIVVDGAHNPAGATALRRSLQADFVFRKLILIFAALDDKDYRRMLHTLASCADMVILTRPEEGRALDPDVLFAVARKYCAHVVVKDDSRTALRHAVAMTGAADMICAAGSLYLVAEIKRASSDLFSPQGR